MSRNAILILLSVLAAATLAALAALDLLGSTPSARVQVPPRAAHEEVNRELREARSEPKNEGPRGGTTGTSREQAESTGPTGRGRKHELIVRSRTDFMIRLRELGLDVRPGAFDSLRGQRVDRGVVIVLVTDEENAVVEGARVRLELATPENMRSHVGDGSFSKEARGERTDIDGLARFSNTRVGLHLLAVSHPDFLTRSFGSIESLAGNPTFVEAVLKRGDAVIEGLVVDEQGAGIGGVSMAASRYVEGGVPHNAIGTTEFDGQFTLRVQAGTRSRVLASRIGYREAVRENVAAGMRNVRIVLEETATVRIEGFVTEGTTSEPVVQFTVDGEPFQHPGGRFEVERNKSETPVTLLFDAEGFDPETRTINTSSGEDIDLGQVPLFGKHRLNGIVLLSGEEGVLTPLAGATVTVTEEQGLAESTTTNGDGLFAFEGLAAERVTLGVIAPGAAPHEQLLELLRGEPTYVEVVLEPGQYRASGTVIDDETEEPIEGARIEVVERPELATTTDVNGAWALENIPLERFSLRANSSGYREAKSATLEAGPDGAVWAARLVPSGLRLEFVLGGAPAPQGTVVWLWKRIEPTLAAALAAQASLGELRLEQLINEEGRVTFDVEDGEYFVQVEAYHLLPTPVMADEQDSAWKVIELPGRTMLQVQVQYADGSPVANTSLWLHSGDQDYSTMMLYHTDGTGRVDVPYLAPRTYALSIIKSQADQSAQYVHELGISGAPHQSLNVAFPPLTASLSGRLTDEQGLPRAGVMIGVEYLDAPHRSILAGWVGSDSDGRYEVPRLEPGRHILRTAWTDDESVFSEEFTLSEGQHLELDLVMPRVAGRRVTGSMIAVDGGPLGGSFVFATDDQGRQNGNFFSTMAWGYVGAFEVKGLRAGSYAIDLTAMGCRKQRTQVSVTGDVSGLVVTMERE